MAIVTALLVALAFAEAQNPVDVRHWFEAGRYQQVIDAADAGAPPAVVYLAGLAAQKLNQPDIARAQLNRLSERLEKDPWQSIGMSAVHLLDGNAAAARVAADRAVSLGADLPEAHYQLGLVLANQQQWAPAAATFDRAAALDPALAYASYYGGLMHYRAKRPDQMAIRFERFLKLAPEAPERPEVQQIMRTIRGK